MTEQEWPEHGEIGEQVQYRRLIRSGRIYQCATWSPGWLVVLPHGPLAATTGGNVSIRGPYPDDGRKFSPVIEHMTEQDRADLEAETESAVSEWKRDNPRYRGFPKRCGAPDALASIARGKQIQ